MTAPDTALVRLAWALGLGLVLGALYGFLRPLRRRIFWPADLIIVAASFWAWVYLSFGVCRGDIRMGATAALGLGALTWEMTVGKLLRKPISMLWKQPSPKLVATASPAATPKPLLVPSVALL